MGRNLNTNVGGLYDGINHHPRSESQLVNRPAGDQWHESMGTGLYLDLRDNFILYPLVTIPTNQLRADGARGFSGVWSPASSRANSARSTPSK